MTLDDDLEKPPVLTAAGRGLLLRQPAVQRRMAGGPNHGQRSAGNPLACTRPPALAAEQGFRTRPVVAAFFPEDLPAGGAGFKVWQKSTQPQNPVIEVKQ